MANIIDLSTAGVKLVYAPEETAGTRPSAGYTQIHGIKSIPSLNPAPETLEATTLDATEFKTYVEGLKDLGGSLEFLANLTENLMDEWDTLLTLYQTTIASGKNLWFSIVIPGLTQSVFFSGKPSSLGAPEIGVNSILETNVYITPNNEPAWYEVPSVNLD